MWPLALAGSSPMESLEGTCAELFSQLPGQPCPRKSFILRAGITPCESGPPLPRRPEVFPAATHNCRGGGAGEGACREHLSLTFTQYACAAKLGPVSCVLEAVPRLLSRGPRLLGLGPRELSPFTSSNEISSSLGTSLGPGLMTCCGSCFAS